MRGPGLLLLMSACGRLGFDPQPAVSSDGDIDADAIVPTCTTWGPFGTPVVVPELGSPTDDWFPRLTADGLMIVFFSARAGTLGDFDVFGATRATTQDPFSTPISLPGVNSAVLDSVPWISPDGLMLVFSSLRPGGVGMLDLWQTTRPTRSATFEAPTLMPVVNSSSTETVACLSPDLLQMYLASDRITGANDLYVASRTTPTDSFGTPVRIPELASVNNERGLTLSSDGLEGFFSSDRMVAFDYEIYRTTRASLSSPFTTPQIVPELSSAMDDVNPALSADGSTLYLNYSTETAGGANSEIFVATRPCLD